MTQLQIKPLEMELWATADSLRDIFKLTAAEYKDPLLGLIFLRYAQNRYEEAQAKMEESLPVNPRMGKKRLPTKGDFLGVGAIMLPELMMGSVYFEQLSASGFTGLKDEQDVGYAATLRKSSSQENQKFIR